MDYRFIAIAGAIIEGPDATRVDCEVSFLVTGIQSPVWTSIDPPPIGAYNSYLSCTNCVNPTLTPSVPPVVPSQLTYRVCGTLINNICEENTDCDEITIEIYPAISLSNDGKTFNFCQDGLPGQWTVPIIISPPSDYQIIIIDPNGGTSNVTNYSDYILPGSYSGTY